MSSAQHSKVRTDLQTREVTPLEVVPQRGDNNRDLWQTRLTSDLSLAVHDAFLRLIVKAGRYLGARSKFVTLALGVVMIAVIGALDLLTGPEIGLSVFYLVPIGFITWTAGRTAGIALSLLSAGVWLAADLGGGLVYSSPAIPYWNAGVRLALFLIVTHTLAALSVSLEWARTDYLTGLVNTRGFHDLAFKQLHQARRSGRTYSLAYLDIDDFKSVNDELGHLTGDALLRLLGDTLRQATRKSDIVARVGGDEFAIWFLDAGFETAVSAMRHIQETLQTAAAKGGRKVTFSVGLATFQEPSESIAESVAQADSLMYAAKQAGKNTIVHRVIQRAA